MAKSQPKIDDVKLLQEALATKLEAITKAMVEEVLTGEIDSHQHNYATSSQGDKADTAIQGVSVNNTELASDDNKKVNITVPTTVSELSDSNEYARLSNGKILEENLPVATDTEVGGIKIGFEPGNDGAIPIKLVSATSKAYIELLADNIRYAIANDTIVNGKKYWLKNKTIIIPDNSAEEGEGGSGYNEGLRIANNPYKYSMIALGADNSTAGLNLDKKQWNIIKHPNGELTISYDSGFITDLNENIIKTGLTLYKNGDIYWKDVKLNLPRATPDDNGWLHADDFTRFGRTADHAQITLASGKLEFSEEQKYIGGHEIFVNGNSPDFDDYGLYDGDGSYNLVAGRRYEVIINMGMSIPAGGGLITLQLEETGGGVIKSTPMTANEGYFTMSLSCIVNGGIPIIVSIQKDSGMELNLEQNQCWFAVHEIK